MQEKQTKIKELAVNYKIIGSGKTPVVLLHGWGVSSDKYVATAEEILKGDSDFKFYIPDLPGFGKSEEPQEDWNIDDYVEFAREFVKNVAQRETGFQLVKNIIEGAIQNNGQAFSKNNKRIVLLGHSFGGRIAIKYAVRYPEDIEKLVLTGAAGIKHPLTQKQQILFCLSKIGKNVFRVLLLKGLEKYAKKFLYVMVREKDYDGASPRMKEVMKNALAEDLTPFLEKIHIAALLVWGENDNSTPLADGELMRDMIEGSDLFIIKEANHSVVYNNAEEFAKIFLENCKDI
ncbi:MAG: alpha/beta hydrolase [Candidatus Pacebacteria bacterium]|jgi:pimeloyl-ACP methyl ester carboxylesterase|nr:alpha/beta hydrolase [Candidatus Paceibacterota bacterium]